MSFILTVKQPGRPAAHYAVEKKVQAVTEAQRLGARLERGGSVTILERTASGTRPIGGIMKVNPRRRRRR